MPHYLLTTSIPSEGAPVVRERLVQARNEAAAIKHVVADTIQIRRAGIEDAMRLAGTAKVEIAAE